MIDKNTCRVYKNNEEIVLSRQEYKLLTYLLENKNYVLSKEQILSHIWDNEGKFVDNNTAALLSGISSLTYSSQRSTLENNKAIYGDWHYYLNVPADVLDSVYTGEGVGFDIVQFGTV